MPVTMDRPLPVAVLVEMTREDSRFTAQRCIKWIILRRPFMVVPMPVTVAVLVVTMVVLGEFGFVTMRVTAVTDDDRHGKLRQAVGNPGPKTLTELSHRLWDLNAPWAIGCWRKLIHT